MNVYQYLEVKQSNSLILENKQLVVKYFKFFFNFQVEVKRTKNTERRVQRQVVLEDGRVLNVGGPPHVVVDTIEDIETHETNHVEDQNIIDELKCK